jgi:GT2 family glycosyltransferase
MHLIADGRRRYGTTARARTTVVVMTRNRRASLARTLVRLDALPERPPVIVVDNGSEDGTSALVARRFPRVQTIALAANAGPAARTLGADAARTPYVAFADDDSWWQPGALALAQFIFDAYPRLGALAARTLVGPEQVEDPINDAMRRSPLGRDADLPGPSVLGFLACASIVRRSALLEVGGFRELAMGFEETPLAVAMASQGWAVVYVDEVVAEHHPMTAPEREPRRRGHVRNELVFTWRRRPLGTAIRRTLRLFRDGLTEPAVLRGLLDGAREAPRLYRERDVVDERVELSLRRLNL